MDIKILYKGIHFTDSFCFITYENVLCEINVPKPKSSSLRNYTIESDDINLINNKSLEFISSN